MLNLLNEQETNIKTKKKHNKIYKVNKLQVENTTIPTPYTYKHSVLNFYITRWKYKYLEHYLLVIINNVLNTMKCEQLFICFKVYLYYLCDKERKKLNKIKIKINKSQ